jgi:hypothetical protein
MKQIKVFFSTLALGFAALLPAATMAGELDDLDVTMELVADVAGVGDVIADMRGPDRDGASEEDDRVDEDDGASEDGDSGDRGEHEDDASDEHEFEDKGDGFTDDDDFT